MIRAHPVTSFLGIAFGVSYALGIPFNAFASSILDGSTLAGVYVPRIVTVIGPAAAALVVARAGGGVIPAARLCRPLRVGLIDVGWLAAVAVVALSCAAVAFAAEGLRFQEQFELAVTRAPALLGHVLVQVMLIGIGEELGWRGWLLPTLTARRTFPVATALTGVAWTAWHFPVYLFGTARPVPFTALLAALTIVFSWLWHRTGGRTAVVAIAHGFVNAPFVFLEQSVRPLPGGDALTARAFASFAACHAVVALIMCVADRHTWRARPPLPFDRDVQYQ